MVGTVQSWVNRPEVDAPQGLRKLDRHNIEILGVTGLPTSWSEHHDCPSRMIFIVQCSSTWKGRLANRQSTYLMLIKLEWVLTLQKGYVKGRGS